ncbi:hypothetical protein JOF48_002542 [Arthrobacter stackebrandtii]|uniref:Uncharacterized protein n=1 Tax=Arthrobacter stackebrandtii TaxID=272161 RepID=A0ABS4Z0H7_9MICC|nr:DUF6541 family protein [Arthrobacter stackebrandtii]MBP2413743.1 hypothetical protein [Arthrobacter stackebrandtii]PYG98691.1 hypothetical protein CVV67_19230 [Arthrobacter stackebrandtii]
MSWFETVPVILAAALVIFVPGAVLGRALGARGLAWLAASAPLTASLVAVGTIAAAAIELTWNPLVLGAFTVLASAAAWGVRTLVAARLAVVRGRTAESRLRTPDRPRPALLLAGLGGFCFSAATLGTNLARTFIAPENISNTYDNVHHLSAVRAVVESGNGSAFDVGSMIHNGPSSVYPFTWHNLVALTMELGNVASLPAAVNSANIVIGAMVWTLGCMFLATRVAGTRPAVLLVAGVLAGGFGAFPFLALGWGVLYPNFLAIALLPTFVGLVADVLKLSPKPRVGTALGVVLLVLGAPGLALSHPNIVMTLAAFTVPMLLFWLVRLFAARRHPWQATAAASAGVALYLVVFVVAWDRIRPSSAGSHWPPTLTFSDAVGEALAVAPHGVPAFWPVFLLILSGLAAVCVQWRRIWAAGIFFVAALFFVVVASFPEAALRNAITGVFFNDSNRLAALLPVAALPIMAAGAVWLWDLAVKLIPAGALDVKPRAMVLGAVGGIAALLLGLAMQNNSLQAVVASTGDQYYASTPESWLLSSDEAALLKRAPEHIPAGAMTIGHPANGGSLIYALDNYPTVVPSLSSAQSPEIQLIWTSLPQLNDDPAVCEAVRKLDAYYYLDFGSGRQVSDMRMTIPSSEDLAATPGLTLLDEQGAARLYRIDACG